jgi:hypothetical protein
MDKKLEFESEFNGNNRQISVIRNDDNSYAVNFETIAMAVIEYEDNCWTQIHGSKLPQDFIDHIGSYIKAAEL